MLTVELANLIHTTGAYVVFSILLIVVWITASSNTRRQYYDTLINHADSEAQSKINTQSITIKRQRDEITKLKAVLKEERVARIAIMQTLHRAMRIGTLTEEE